MKIRTTQPIERESGIIHPSEIKPRMTPHNHIEMESEMTRLIEITPRIPQEIVMKPKITHPIEMTS